MAGFDGFRWGDRGARAVVRGRFDVVRFANLNHVRFFFNGFVLRLLLLGLHQRTRAEPGNPVGVDHRGKLGLLQQPSHELTPFTPEPRADGERATNGAREQGRRDAA